MTITNARGKAPKAAPSDQRRERSKSERPDRKQARGHALIVRMTAGELEAVQKAAHAAGITASALVRSRCLGEVPQAIEIPAGIAEAARVLTELADARGVLVDARDVLRVRAAGNDGGAVKATVAAVGQIAKAAAAIIDAVTRERKRMAAEKRKAARQ